MVSSSHNYFQTEGPIVIRSSIGIKIVTFTVLVGIPIVFTTPAFAAGGDVAQVQTFIRSVIQVVAGLAGLVATGFIVVGGFTYITSSGNPEHLDRAKRTLFFSGGGLAIVIAAFVLSNIVTTLATQAFGA
tara:strand:- start:2516 stop:2905 length:390 start_codon:yes stop_codon:yes gene_type:complete